MTTTIGLPQLRVAAEGLPLPGDAARALGHVRVQQRLSLPALCELTFYDPPGPLTAVSLLTLGTDLRVAVGEWGVPLFEGEVTAVQRVYGPAGGRELRVRGYDRLHRLRKRGEPRAYAQVTLTDLAQEMTADLGIVVQAAESGPLWRRIVQHDQSDFEFLEELAAQCGLYLTLRGDVLHLLTLEGTGAPLPLALGDRLLETRIEASAEPACRTVTTSGWNPLHVEAYQGRAVSARTGRQVATGVSPDRVGGSDEYHRPGEALRDQNHADAVAQGELDRRETQKLTLWGMAQGDPRLRPGSPVVVTGIGERLAGRYTLTAVTHTVDSRKGFVSEFSTTAPPPHERTPGAVAALGVVTRVDDPEELGRVRVSLPAYGDVETEWMHVLTAGAGEHKGLMVLPDVADHVLVLFSHGDPGQGVVLGALYGMQGSPDSGVEGTSVRRYTLLTPGGQRIQLDDVRQRIRLADSTGSYVELSPDRVHLHAAVDLELEAPGQAVIIRGQSIDFERE
ncbi:MAG: phage baseplate assembly protein V [Anaerolineae bacterium]